MSSVVRRTGDGCGIPAFIEERWQQSWQLCGEPARSELLAAIVARYSEPQRAYHNLQHIADCLERVFAVRSCLSAPAEVELALWYHDVVYDPRRSDNEERSADLAREHVGFLPADVVHSVCDLILATKHSAIPKDPDAKFVVDIDLSILGAPPLAFDAYEAAIRREYRWVPGPLYRRRRREILQSFLDRDRIYATDHFASLLENQARLNLTRSIAQLS